jgi:NAD(P)H-dependent FMN reductase
MASKPIHILGIAGSLRRESYNRGALRAATKLVPEGAILETFELHGIPVFNQDRGPEPAPQSLGLQTADTRSGRHSVRDAGIQLLRARCAEERD